jgi:hypothetical protein
VGQFPFSKWFGVALAVLILFGPVVGPHVDHNGWRYLVTPLLCAPVTATYFCLFPPNPYKGYSARAAGLLDLGSRDVNAARLVSLFRSKDARAVLWRATGQVVMIEVIAMTVLLIICAVTDRVVWTPSSSWLWQGIVGCCLGSFIAIGSDLFAWVTRTWVAAEHS